MATGLGEGWRWGHSVSACMMCICARGSRGVSVCYPPLPCAASVSLVQVQQLATVMQRLQDACHVTTAGRTVHVAVHTHTHLSRSAPIKSRRAAYVSARLASTPPWARITRSSCSAHAAWLKLPAGS